MKDFQKQIIQDRLRRLIGNFKSLDENETRLITDGFYEGLSSMYFAMTGEELTYNDLILLQGYYD